MTEYADQRGHDVTWMTAQERNEKGPCVCAGTGNHEGQPVTACDECQPDEEWYA